MIKTVIFDIGMVLMRFDWSGYIEKKLGKEIGAIVTEAMWMHGVWNELDRGVWTDEELLDGFYSYAPDYKKEILTAFRDVSEACFAFDYAIPWVKQLKAMGYQVLYLSNYSHYLMDLAPEVLNFLPYMDGGVFSCDVHLCKPDRRIYETICDKYQLKPEECFFIDDNANNVAAAKEFGIHAYRFTDYATDYDTIMSELQK